MTEKAWLKWYLFSEPRETPSQCLKYEENHDSEILMFENGRRAESRQNEAPYHRRTLNFT